jgi:hypothetical protein
LEDSFLFILIDVNNLLKLLIDLYSASLKNEWSGLLNGLASDVLDGHFGWLALVTKSEVPGCLKV